MCLFACNVFCSIDVIDMRISLNLTLYASVVHKIQRKVGK